MRIDGKDLPARQEGFYRIRRLVLPCGRGKKAVLFRRAKFMQHSRKFSIFGQTVDAPPLEPGLYIVSTPIGNLGDITLRALQALAAADLIASEDTRVSRVLLDRYGISARPFAYHDHNAATAGLKLIAALDEGRSVALISDAGTPLISDPGFRLVNQALEAGHKVIPVPGASAVLTALAASGLATDAFFFAGFPPPKSAARKSRLEELATVPATLVFYESPRRLPECLADMAEVLGATRPAVVARELTKRFEEFRRGNLQELAAIYAEEGPPKGEVVICIAPPDARAEMDVDMLLRRLAAELPASRAAAEAARLTGQPRGELYRRLLQLPEEKDGGA